MVRTAFEAAGITFLDDDGQRGPGLRYRELWPKLGDGGVSKAAYRGGWKPA